MYFKSKLLLSFSRYRYFPGFYSLNNTIYYTFIFSMKMTFKFSLVEGNHLSVLEYELMTNLVSTF